MILKYYFLSTFHTLIKIEEKIVCNEIVCNKTCTNDDDDDDDHEDYGDDYDDDDFKSKTNISRHRRICNATRTHSSCHGNRMPTSR